MNFSIDVACSGVYSLIGFVIFAVFIAYINRGKLYGKLAILLLGIPLIIVLNIIRITTILAIGNSLWRPTCTTSLPRNGCNRTHVHRNTNPASYNRKIHQKTQTPTTLPNMHTLIQTKNSAPTAEKYANKQNQTQPKRHSKNRQHSHSYRIVA